MDQKKFDLGLRLKYPEKLLVWITISKKSIGEPFVIPKKALLTGRMHKKDCVKQRLVPFFEKHHADGDYFFWPNLARISSTSLNFFLYPVDQTPLILKAKVYDGGWGVKTFKMLRQRIRKLSWKQIISLYQNIFATLKTKIWIAADKGVMAVM